MYFREERGGRKETGGHIIKYHSKPCNHGNHSAVFTVLVIYNWEPNLPVLARFVSSFEPRLSIPDFVLQLWRNFFPNLWDKTRYGVVISLVKYERPLQFHASGTESLGSRLICKSQGKLLHSDPCKDTTFHHKVIFISQKRHIPLSVHLTLVCVF